MTTIATTVGTADVLHRLAVAVEVVDAVTGQLAGPTVRAGREVPPLRQPTVPPFAPPWPCLDLDAHGAGRFVLRHDRPLPSLPLTIRLDDPTRRYAPRRFRLPLWTLAQVSAGDQTPPAGEFVAPRARLLRPWLLPGSAYALPRSVTAIRGRVVRNAVPVRWPRVFAVDAANVTVGQAHGDDRGEFVLIITNSGMLPPPVSSTVDVELAVFARDPAAPVDPLDRCADLVVEPVARSSNPPLPAELDNDLLRGESRPGGYLPSTLPRPQLTVPVGEPMFLTADVEFDI